MNTPPEKFVTTQLLFQLGGMLLTIIALSFTVTRPTIDRIDELRQAVTELKATTAASDLNQSAMDTRLRRIETDLYQLRQDYTNDRKPNPSP